MSMKLMKPKIFSRFFSFTCRKAKYIRVLGIETSCDDTCAAVVDSNRNILGETHQSQAAIHAVHGGILPPIAMLLHKENIRDVVRRAMEKSKLQITDLDAVAVTIEPGIKSSLEVGLEYAKDLCVLYQKPLMPVHHMQAHALTIRFLEDIKFPFLILLISGGHCILAIAESVTKFSVLGETLDNAPGVVFDKLSRRLKLNNLKKCRYMQGGAAIETLATQGNALAIDFPRTLKQTRDCNFSFSGLKTSVKKYIQNEEKVKNIAGNELLPNLEDICASFQYALAKHLCERVETGMKYIAQKGIINSEEKVLGLSGGVACNEFIRQMLKYVCDQYGYKFIVPPKNLCTDNGVMIAWNAIEKLGHNIAAIEPAKISTLECNISCKLGESLADDVKDKNIKGKYVKLKKIIS